MSACTGLEGTTEHQQRFYSSLPLNIDVRRVLCNTRAVPQTLCNGFSEALLGELSWKGGDGEIGNMFQSSREAEGTCHL